MIQLSAAAIAEKLGGRLIGNPEIMLTGPGALDRASGGQFVYAGGRRAFRTAASGGCSLILASKVFSDTSKAVVMVDDPRAAFAVLLRFFEEKKRYSPGVSPLASVHPTATIASTVYIAPFAVVGEGVVLMDGVVLLDGAVLRENVRVAERSYIGERVVVHSGSWIGRDVSIAAGAVIGGNGFGYEKSSGGGWDQIPQLGVVVIEDEVAIGCNCTIDRATAGETRIGHGTCLDNMVHVAHNVIIGPENLILAQAGIAGSVTTGCGCIIGGQVGIADHCRIGDNVVIGSGSGVQRHALKSDTMYWGNPAREMTLSASINAALRELPAIAAEWRKRRRGEV